MENYDISWKLFNEYLIDHNRILLSEKIFTDVTLVSDDLVQIEAHRSVLSGASSVLKQLLLMNSARKPLLFLKGIKHEDLEAMLEFIYVGETKVQESRVQEFAKIGLDLKIKQLCENTDRSDDSEIVLDEEEMQAVTADLVTKENNIPCEQCDQKFKTRRNMRRHLNAIHYKIKYDCKECGISYFYKDQLRKHEREVHKNLEQTLDEETKAKEDDPNDYTTSSSNVCQYCDKSYENMTILRRHVKTFHDEMREEKKYKCNQCNKSFSCSKSLHRHTISVHERRIYKCKWCENTYSVRENAKRHAKIKHPAELDEDGNNFCEEIHSEQMNNSTDEINDNDHETNEEKTNVSEEGDVKTEGLDEKTEEIDIKYSCQSCPYEATHEGNLKTHIQLAHCNGMETD